MRRTILARAAAAALAACGLALPARANDTSAEMAAGGLVFVKNPDVEMRAEDLFVSTSEVRVRYRFFNNAAKDVSVRVAFPMPDVTIESPDDDITIPTDDPENLLGFRTTVDGRPVKAEVEQIVTRKGVDHTRLLRSLGVPLSPHLPAAGAALDALPAATRDRLVKLGLAEVDEFDAGKGWERHLAPRWTLKATYHWQQVFPAGREIAVEHRYTPAVGGSAGTMLGSPAFLRDPELLAMKRRYCIDDAFVAAVDKARRAAKIDNAPFSETRIAYILTTGANWSAPIGDFRLTVDKGAATNLVSFCGEGVRKTGPTRFEVRHSRFTPKQDLYVLILTPYPPGN